MALRLLAAFAALGGRLGVVSGCAGGSANPCSGIDACPIGEFCNFDSGSSGICEGCGDSCSCGLPQRGESECNSVCMGPPRGTDGCCCASFNGHVISSDCSAQVCGDMDLQCCGFVFSRDGVCNEPEECFCPDGQRGGTPGSGLASCMNCDDFPGNPHEQCTPGPGTTGSPGLPGWDRDCGVSGYDEECMTRHCSGGDGYGDPGECEELRDEEGNCISCPWFILGLMSLFVFAGVSLMSCAVVNDKLTGDRFRLHQEQGTEVAARCIARWMTTTTSSGENGTSTTHHFHNTFVFSVPMPTPTPTAQHLLITKEFEVDQATWANEGAMVQINHLLGVTGDARNATLVAEMSARTLSPIHMRRCCRVSSCLRN
jgi:hypothetical protein